MTAGIREYSPGRYGISRGARERMTRVVFCPEGKDATPLRVLAQCRQEQTARHIARLFQRERDAQAKAAAAQEIRARLRANRARGGAATTMMRSTMPPPDASRPPAELVCRERQPLRGAPLLWCVGNPLPSAWWAVAHSQTRTLGG